MHIFKYTNKYVLEYTYFLSKIMCTQYLASMSTSIHMQAEIALKRRKPCKNNTCKEPLNFEKVIIN